MKRTIISIEEEDKKWLDRRAEKEGVPMTELVRRAVHLLRRRIDSTEPPTEDLLDETSGIWESGNGLDYQKKLRDEWQ